MLGGGGILIVGGIMNYYFLIMLFWGILALMIGIVLKNKTMRYNSIACLKEEIKILEAKIAYNKSKINVANEVEINNLIYEDTIRVQSLEDEIQYRIIHYMLLFALVMSGVFYFFLFYYSIC